MRYFLKFFLVFVTAPLSSLLAKTSILFLVYNAGEAEPFREVAKNLTTDYKIVGIGMGKDKFKDDPHLVSIDNDPFSEGRLNIPSHDTDTNRDRLLKAEVLAQILALEPSIVVSGMAAAWQAQVLNAAHTQGAKTVAFYDNMNGPMSDQPYVKPFMAGIDKRTVSAWLVPGDAYKTEFEGNVLALGQPTLEQWDSVFKTPNTSIPEKLGLKQGQKLILFAGGHDKSYAQYVATMMEAVQERDDILLAITPHPARQHHFEEEILQQLGNPSNIKIVTDLKTIDIAPFAAIFAAHKSSMGTHALAHGIPVLYVGPYEDYQSMLVVGDGLGVVAQNRTEVNQAIDTALKLPQKPSLEKLGIPDNAAMNIANFLETEAQSIPHRQAAQKNAIVPASK